MKKVINQWSLIIIINEGLNEVEKCDAWRKSFIRVNMCPSQRVPFQQWIESFEESVKAADRFFKDRASLFDAMPAVWQHLTEGNRRQLCSFFDTFTGPWSTEYLKEIMQLGLCKADDISQLHGCYLTSKEDLSMSVDPTTSAVEDEPSDSEKPKRQCISE